jgi:phosphatidate cytidylyltransferase
LISYLGGNWLLGLITLLSAIGIMEYIYRTTGFRPVLPSVVTVIFAVGMVVISVILSHFAGIMLLIAYFLIISMLSAVRNEPPGTIFQNITRLLWGTAYIGLLYPFVFFVRDISEIGGDWMLFLFGTLWLSDSLAMWIGKAIGKRKLAPTVSPGKTMAGFIGGLAGGPIVAMILVFWRLEGFSPILLIVGGLMISFIGQLGDLVESCWKRSIGIKDSSSIIPGHGGVLDRFDSLLFAAPVLYIYLRYFVYS